jgi:hypothetical protein
MAFNRYAAGRKQYGSGRDFPTMGKVDPTGYKERDAMAKARKRAMMAKTKAGRAGRLMSPEFLKGMK